MTVDKELVGIRMPAAAAAALDRAWAFCGSPPIAVSAIRYASLQALAADVARIVRRRASLRNNPLLYPSRLPAPLRCR